MEGYSFVEFADMYLVYGAFNGNSRVQRVSMLSDILGGVYQIIAHFFLVIAACVKQIDYR